MNTDVAKKKIRKLFKTFRTLRKAQCSDKSKFDSNESISKTVDEGFCFNPSLKPSDFERSLSSLTLDLSVPQSTSEFPSDCLSCDSEDDEFITVQVNGKSIEVNCDGLFPVGQTTIEYRARMKDRLVQLGQIGRGASSVVSKAFDLQSMRIVALKKIEILDRDRKEQMICELQSLYRLLSHSFHSSASTDTGRDEPYVVDFYDAFSSSEGRTVSFMLEYMGAGSLKEWIDSGRTNDEQTLSKIAVQLLMGIRFLHDKGKLHRDLKPANFLISSEGNVKIADLGLMKDLGGNNWNKTLLTHTNSYLGTSVYMSPERLEGKDYSFPSDIWSFGMTMMFLAFRKIPFNNVQGYWKMLDNIRDTPLPRLPEVFSPYFQDFVDKCLIEEPEERWDCDQLLLHPFVADVPFGDLLLNVEKNPEKSKNELLSIFEASFSHIQNIQNFKDIAGFEALNSSLFGELEGEDPCDVLERLFTREVTLKDGLYESPGKRTRKSNEQPLKALAQQLNMSRDELISELQNFLECKRAERCLKAV